jgi:hypothetical protein
MDVQTSLPQQYEDPQEVSIEVQQRLEAKILKTVKLHSLVKLTFLKDATPIVTPHVSKPHDYVNHMFKRR